MKWVCVNCKSENSIMVVESTFIIRKCVNCGGIVFKLEEE